MGIFMKVPQLTLAMSSSRCLILKRCVSCLNDDGRLVNIWTEKEELFPFLFRILLCFDFFICGQTFYCQQIFLTRMTRYEWIYKKIYSIINGNLLLYRMFDWLHMNSDVGVGTKFFLESFLNSCCYWMSIFQCCLSIHAPGGLPQRQSVVIYGCLLWLL